MREYWCEMETSKDSLIKDVNRRKGMGKSAYREAEKYLPESIIRQWETLFENLTTI